MKLVISLACILPTHFYFRRINPGFVSVCTPHPGIKQVLVLFFILNTVFEEFKPATVTQHKSFEHLNILDRS